jgi:hypothetical protein
VYDSAELEGSVVQWIDPVLEVFRSVEHLSRYSAAQVRAAEHDQCVVGEDDFGDVTSPGS